MDMLPSSTNSSPSSIAMGVLTSPTTIAITPSSIGYQFIIPNTTYYCICRARQHGLTPNEYIEAMAMELEDLDDERMDTFKRMATQKKKVARAYNKRVKKKSFVESELVGKVILRPRTKDTELEK
ncbi:uncharacterized protein LOC131169797 [Hevea brasiliensis]|uniref:uncharacterized protein LOC131169797 n=1 Tax=Hevea brasiliensis TaxID=3981 RepID=UPI0025FC73E6|nr:uncharacterized protein LOC131169797 [Hevea brasiliensis]